MQRLKDTNLTVFVFVLLVFVLLIPGIITASIILSNTKENMQNDLTNFHKRVNKILASSLSTPLWEFRNDIAQKVITPIQDDKRVVSIKVTDTQTDQTFLHTKPKKIAGNHNALTQKIFHQEIEIGKVTLVVTDYYMHQTLQKQQVTLLVIFTLQFIISFILLVLLFNKKILKPVNKLLSQANLLSKGRFEQTFSWNQDDELGILGKSFEFARASLQKNIKKLQLQNRRYESIIEGTNVGTWEWNIQTGDVVFNQKWAQIIGYSLSELEPISIKTWMEHAHPDDLVRSDTLLQKHFNGELDYYECETRMKHRDGHWVWVLDRGKVTRWDKNGNPLLISGTHQDITLRKKSEKALQDNNELLNKLSQQLPGFLYKFELRQDGSQIFSFASSGVHDIYEVTPQQIRNNADIVFERVHKDDLHKVRQTIADSAQNLTLWQCDYRVSLPTKGEKWVRGIAKPEKKDDGTILWFGYLSDITELKEKELELLRLNKNLQTEVQKQVETITQKDKLLQEQAKLAAMGEMIGAIAHQWRQPLNALNINIQNLDDDYDEGLIDTKFIQNFIDKQT
ncbi:MAG: PAS domain-containing protein, partial [Campylobacterota bacterium]